MPSDARCCLLLSHGGSRDPTEWSSRQQGAIPIPTSVTPSVMTCVKELILRSGRMPGELEEDQKRQTGKRKY